MSRSPRTTWNLLRSSQAGSSKACRIPILLLILLLILAPVGDPVLAQSGWQVVDTQVSAGFADSLDVALHVRHDQPIVDVILFYGRVGDRLVRRIYPPFTPGTEVTMDYSEPFHAGQFAPGTELRVWWRLTDATGEAFDTIVETIRYVDDSHDWESLEGENATLYYYDVRQSRAAGWLDEAESALEKIQSDLGIALVSPVDIYVYRNEGDMSAALATRSDDYDARVTTLGVAVDEDTLILLGSQSDLELTMAHELSHIVVGMATDNPYAGLPRWLDEGLAMLAEGELPRQNAVALKLGISRDELLSVRSMTSYSGRADQVDLYYGECYSVVDFMIETYGRDKMTELLQVFAEGTSQHDALQRVYGLTIEELDARWRISLGLEPRSSLDPLRFSAGYAPAHCPC